MKIFSSIIILTLISACNTMPTDRGSDIDSFNLTEITMIELDKSKKFPIHTIITIKNDRKPSISYTKKIKVASYQIDDVKKAWGAAAFKKIEKSWQRDFSVSDLKYINRYAEGLKIFLQNEKELPSARSTKTCDHNNFRFFVKSETKEINSFTIPGNLLCQDNNIMRGFRKFIKEMNALVLKYQPHLFEIASL
jgi:hypothetical protein